MVFCIPKRHGRCALAEAALLDGQDTGMNQRQHDVLFLTKRRDRSGTHAERMRVHASWSFVVTFAAALVQKRTNRVLLLRTVRDRADRSGHSLEQISCPASADSRIAVQPHDTVAIIDASWRNGSISTPSRCDGRGEVSAWALPFRGLVSRRRYGREYRKCLVAPALSGTGIAAPGSSHRAGTCVSCNVRVLQNPARLKS